MWFVNKLGWMSVWRATNSKGGDFLEVPPLVWAARGGAEAGTSHHFRGTARGREAALRLILPTEMGQAARNVFPSQGFPLLLGRIHVPLCGPQTPWVVCKENTLQRSTNEVIRHDLLILHYAKRKKLRYRLRTVLSTQTRYKKHAFIWLVRLPLLFLSQGKCAGYELHYVSILYV